MSSAQDPQAGTGLSAWGAGGLVVASMIGNLAVYKRGRVEWDPVNLKPLNDPMLMHIVRPTFRDGYEV